MDVATAEEDGSGGVIVVVVAFGAALFTSTSDDGASPSPSSLEELEDVFAVLLFDDDVSYWVTIGSLNNNCPFDVLR